MIDPLLTTSGQYFLAALLLLSGVHKVTHLQRFKQALAAYQLVPACLMGMMAIALPIGELFAGTLLLLSVQFWGGFAAALMFSLYFLAMLINIQRGHTRVDCGCSFSRQEAPLSPWHLIRNGFLIALAVFTLLPSNGRDLMGFDIVQISLAILCLGLFYLGFDSLLANRNYQMGKEA